MCMDDFLTMPLRQKVCKVPNKVFSVNFGITNAEK
jgi:hypothetical protein